MNKKNRIVHDKNLKAELKLLEGKNKKLNVLKLKAENQLLRDKHNYFRFELMTL